MNDRRVLVVGAGVAGAATARALGGAGIDVTLVERRDDEPGAGLGLNLPGNAVRALRRLGAAGPVEAAGVPIVRRDYRNASGRLLFTVDEAAFWAGVAPSVCVPRAVLVDALTEGLTVRRGVAVHEVCEVASGVRVRFADGAEKVYDLVVGADGVHSAVRPAVVDAAPQPSAMTATAWRFAAEDPGIGAWTAWTGRGLTCLLIPVAPGRVYGYAARTDGGPVGVDPAGLGPAYAGFAEPVTEVLAGVLAGPAEGADAPYLSPVDEVRAPVWHRGRVLVLGDAAHATGPVWAQGAALALEDALVLARLLASRDDWTAALPAWEAARRPRVQGVQAATDRMSRLAGLPDWLVRLTAPRAGPRGYEQAYAPLRAEP